ncbi:MAG: hypothetical protein AB4062_18445 [Crocosphaera sp.]
MKKFCVYVCLILCVSFWGCQSTSNSNPSQPTTSQQTMTNNSEPPTTVIEAVVKSISEQNSIPSDSLEVQQTEANTWSDGCLGLAKPDEFCTQALVEGWRVTVSNGQTTWVYRTDATGKNIRQES